MSIKTATIEEVKALRGEVRLLLILLAENNGKFLGQAIASEKKTAGCWWFGTILEFNSIEHMDLSAATLMSEIGAEYTYIIRVKHGEPLASTVVIPDNQEEIMVGQIDMAAVTVLAREIQKQRDEEGQTMVYLPDLLEPSTNKPAEEHQGSPFPEGTILN